MLHMGVKHARVQGDFEPLCSRTAYFFVHNKVQMPGNKDLRPSFSNLIAENPGHDSLGILASMLELGNNQIPW